MDTVLIYDQCGVEPIRFAVLKGNYEYLDGVYINSLENEVKQNELNQLLYNEDGSARVEWLNKFPSTKARESVVIVAGFLP